MKREELEALEVEGKKLSKEVVDKIMSINGADIENAKKPFADYESLKTQLADAKTTIEGLQKDGKTIEQAQEDAKSWKEKYDKAIADQQEAESKRLFDDAFKNAVSAAKGKNAGAIIGVMGAEKMETLRNSTNRDADIKAAIEECQKNNGYLFDTGNPPPPYAGGTGGNSGGSSGNNGGSDPQLSHDAYGAAAIRDMLYGSN